MLLRILRTEHFTSIRGLANHLRAAPRRWNLWLDLLGNSGHRVRGADSGFSPGELWNWLRELCVDPKGIGSTPSPGVQTKPT